jgi:GMP synthase-like glutamine amidotransferase
MKVTFVQHDPDGVPGFLWHHFARYVGEKNLKVATPYEKDFEFRQPTGDEILVMMGGSEPVTKWPWFKAEQDLIESFMDLDLPILGVCSGAEMLAINLGESIKVKNRTEYGWTPLTLHPALMTWYSDLFMQFGCWAFEWHDDAFDLPEDAELLVSGDATPCQGFRYGSNIFGVQLHPEMTPAMVEKWTDRDPKVDPILNFPHIISSYYIGRALVDMLVEVADE